MLLVWKADVLIVVFVVNVLAVMYLTGHSSVKLWIYSGVVSLVLGDSGSVAEHVVAFCPWFRGPKFFGWSSFWLQVLLMIYCIWSNEFLWRKLCFNFFCPFNPHLSHLSSRWGITEKWWLTIRAQGELLGLFEWLFFYCCEYMYQYKYIKISFQIF